MEFDIVIYPRLLAPGTSLIAGRPTLPASARKFIVLRGAMRCLVAIGPDWEEGAYYHADILRAVQSEHADLEIHGGGHLRLTDDPMDGPKAWFHGRSTAFGAFDGVLRTPDARLALTRALGRAVAVA